MTTKTIIDSGNNDLTKKTLILNGAGTSLKNPILSGLGITYNLRFFDQIDRQKTFEDIRSPAEKTEIDLTKGVIDTKLFYHEMIAGERIKDQKAFIRTEMTDSFLGSESIVERQLFVASLPDDAVQVLNKQGQWISVNIDRFPGAVPSVSLQCPVRFFATWKDEFDISTYGGSAFVSAFDSGGPEDIPGDDGVLVHDVQQKIKYFHRIQLIKKHPLFEDLHGITFRFRSLYNSLYYVDVDILVKTETCYSMKLFVSNDNFPFYFGGVQ